MGRRRAGPFRARYLADVAEERRERALIGQFYNLTDTEVIALPDDEYDACLTYMAAQGSEEA